MGQRWAIHIDIEGFSQLFKCERNSILLSLRDLIEAIFLIGEKYYNESPNRIFAHQIVDGFTITSEFHDPFLEVPVAISIVLLRRVAASGRFAKASIGVGDSGDYTGYYPDRVKDVIDNGNRVLMGSGIMTLFSVFGTAHIDAYKVHEKSPSGSLLTMDSFNREHLPKECIIKEVSCGTLISIDWVHSQLNLVSEIQNRAGLKSPTVEQIERVLLNYKSSKNPPPNHWIDSTLELLNLQYNN
jgi:hypothetical protein